MARYYTNPEIVTLKGAAAHEVAVGPIHAGVIEPGHFRFQCLGEKVYDLKIHLGYQHRGVEDEIVKAYNAGKLGRCAALVETCAGDTSIAASLCWHAISSAGEPHLGSLPLSGRPSNANLRSDSIAENCMEQGNRTASINAWRGELTHEAKFDENGKMLEYHIYDPSARNWYGLARALRGESIYNFPICNKSFNLSYCGTDR